MICRNCGHEFESGKFCPNCGTPAENVNPTAAEQVCEPPYEAPITAQPNYSQTDAGPGFSGNTQGSITKIFKDIFSDTIFLIVAILMSASTLMNLANKEINVFGILFTIAFWLLYATAKSSENEFKQTGLKLFSGTVKAVYIVLWVAVGILGVACILVLVGSSFLSSMLYNYSGFGEFGGLYGMLAYASVGLIAFICVFLIAFVIVMNIFFVKKIHKFAKSLCVSAKQGQFALEKVKAARQWLFVLGILSGIGALLSIIETSFVAFVAGGALAACYICASIWMKKYFEDC